MCKRDYLVSNGGSISASSCHKSICPTVRPLTCAYQCMHVYLIRNAIRWMSFKGKMVWSVNIPSKVVREFYLLTIWLHPKISSSCGVKSCCLSPAVTGREARSSPTQRQTGEKNQTHNDGRVRATNKPSSHVSLDSRCNAVVLLMAAPFRPKIRLWTRHWEHEEKQRCLTYRQSKTGWGLKLNLKWRPTSLYLTYSFSFLKERNLFAEIHL